MGLDKSGYREDFAIWAIEEALKDFEPSSFQITGKVKEDDSMTYYAGGDKKVLPKEVLKTVRASNQQDVDAEDLNPRAKKISEDELDQDIRGASQALLSASPNSLGHCGRS